VSKINRKTQKPKGRYEADATSAALDKRGSTYDELLESSILDAEIRAYAARHAGTEVDLDKELEAAAIEFLLAEEQK
jgi:hypothetical protein